jgi:phage portal protein BeeE
MVLSSISPLFILWAIRGNKVSVAAGHEMGFLEVLDRRRYEVNLVKEKPERYRAATRRKIDG